jgi:hypothetical protein
MEIGGAEKIMYYTQLKFYFKSTCFLSDFFYFYQVIS